MIYLVTHNDPDILEQLLKWGKRKKMEDKVLQWQQFDQDQDGKDMDQLDGGGCWQLIGQKSAKSLMMQKTVVEGTEDDELMKKNPIQVSVLQGHARCSKMLHRFGWRIPQVTNSLILETLKPSQVDETCISGERGRCSRRRTGGCQAESCHSPTAQ